MRLMTWRALFKSPLPGAGLGLGIRTGAEVGVWEGTMTGPEQAGYPV